MPIEIRELHIKVKVGEQGAESSGSGSSSGTSSGLDKEAVISECVEKVLQILRDKLER